jgi:transcriptional regulator with XRE-family HTH domain
MDPRQLFALNLRRLRHERGWSQEGLAHEAGVNVSHMGAIERGETWVGLEIIAKLGDALDVELSEFFRAPTPRRSKRQ